MSIRMCLVGTEVYAAAIAVTEGYSATHLLTLGRVFIVGNAVAWGGESPLLLRLVVDALSGEDTPLGVLLSSTCRPSQASQRLCHTLYRKESS